MNMDEVLKRLEEKYTEIKDIEFDSRTNYPYSSRICLY
mgnify:CR=1 FL=1